MSLTQELSFLCVGGNCGDLDDIINDLCALEAELTDAQKELTSKQPMTDGDSGNVDDLYTATGANNVSQIQSSAVTLFASGQLNFMGNYSGRSLVLL